jgi:hypothetical protein
MLMPSVIMLKVVIRSIIPSVIMLMVPIRSIIVRVIKVIAVIMQVHYAECHRAECCQGIDGC